MDSERWRQIDRLLQSALKLDPSKWNDFVEKNCGTDQAIRQALESLLESSRRADDFFETPAILLAARILAEDQAAQMNPLFDMPVPADVTAEPGVADESIRLSEGRLSEGRLSEGRLSEGRLSEGVILDGRYLVEKKLGEGGSGIVFLARDQKIPGRPKVAIKVLARPGNDRTEIEESFKTEIEAMAHVSHPGVVRPLDIGALPDGRPYLVMEYAPGEPLRTVMKRQKMTPERIGRLIGKIAQAIDAAHAAGVIHHDLNPSNIIVETESGEDNPKVIDFGIAKLRRADAENTATETAALMGTFGYVAPERWYGVTDVAGDVYSLGVIANEMLTEKQPIPSLSGVIDISGLPRAIRRVIKKASSFEPSDRYRSAAKFSEALIRALKRQGSLRGALNSRRFRLTIVLLLALIAVGIVVVWKLRRIPGPTASERSLTYSLLVKKKELPPFVSFGGIDVTAGDLLRLNVSSSHPGCLYVLNESPAGKDSPRDFIVLFPFAAVNGGSAAIVAGQMVQIPPPSDQPEWDWWEFNQEKGEEKFWLIWSEQIVPELENVKYPANYKDEDKIRDLRLIEAIERYLAAHSLNELKATPDEANKQMRLTGKGATLVGLVKLDHQ